MQITTIINLIKGRVPAFTNAVIAGAIGATVVQQCPAEQTHDDEGDVVAATDTGGDDSTAAGEPEPDAPPVLFDVLPDVDSPAEGQPPICCVCEFPDDVEIGTEHDCLAADVTWSCHATAPAVWVCDDAGQPITCAPEQCE